MHRAYAPIWIPWIRIRNRWLYSSRRSWGSRRRVFRLGFWLSQARITYFVPYPINSCGMLAVWSSGLCEHSEHRQNKNNKCNGQESWCRHISRKSHETTFIATVWDTPQALKTVSWDFGSLAISQKTIVSKNLCEFTHFLLRPTPG